jgi:hypothetical protein
MRKFNILILLAVSLAGFINSISAQCPMNFNSTSGVSVGTDPDGIAAGDFNRDGQAGLAVVNKGSNNDSILLNQGGRFAVSGMYSVGSSPNTIVARERPIRPLISKFYRATEMAHYPHPPIPSARAAEELTLDYKIVNEGVDAKCSWGAENCCGIISQNV